MDKKPYYTTVLHDKRKQLDLSNNDYCVADSIDKLSNNPNHEWCVETQENIGEFLGLTRRGINKIVNTLVGKRLITRNKYGKGLKTTNTWIETTQIDKEGTKFRKRGNKVPKRGNKVPTIIIDSNNDNNIGSAEPTLTVNASKLINNIFKIFIDFNPALKYGNKTERNAINESINAYGYERVEELSEYAISEEVTLDKFAPQVDKPTELFRKFKKLEGYKKREEVVIEPKKQISFN